MDGPTLLRAIAWRVFLLGLFAFGLFPIVFYLAVLKFPLTTPPFWPYGSGVLTLIAWALIVGISYWRAGKTCRNIDSPQYESHWPAARIRSMLQQIWWLGFIFVGFPLGYAAMSFLLGSSHFLNLGEYWLFAFLLMNLENFLNELAPLELLSAQRLYENRRLMKILNRIGWILLSLGAVLSMVGMILVSFLGSLNHRIDAMQSGISPH